MKKYLLKTQIVKIISNLNFNVQSVSQSIKSREKK